MVGWHHWLDGHESEQTPGDGDGQGSLVCCSPWGHKESDMTQWMKSAKVRGWRLQGVKQHIQPRSPPRRDLTFGAGDTGETFSVAPQHNSWRADGHHVEANVSSAHWASSSQVFTQTCACVVVSPPPPQVLSGCWIHLPSTLVERICDSCEGAEEVSLESLHNPLSMYPEQMLNHPPRGCLSPASRQWILCLVASCQGNWPSERGGWPCL